MQIKDNIDLRVDELKAELESAREKLHRQVDLVCGRSIQMTLKKYEDIKRPTFEKEKFFEFQQKMSNMMQEMQQIINSELKMSFTPSDFHFNSAAMLGKLEHNIEAPEISNESELEESTSDKSSVSTEFVGKLKELLNLLFLKSENDEDYIASASFDKTIHIWSTKSDKCVKSLAEHTSAITSVKYLGGGLIACASTDGLVRICNILSGECESILDGFEVPLAIERLNEELLACGDDKGNQVCEWKSAKVCYTLKQRYVYRLKLLNDNVLLCSDTYGRVYAYELSSKACILDSSEHSGWYKVNDFAPVDEQRFASCGNDKTIRLWDLGERKCTRVIKAGCEVKSLIFVQPNVLVSGCGNGKILFWNVNDGELVETIEAHCGEVYSLLLIEPHRLVSGGKDKLIRVWDLDNQKCLKTLTGHSDIISSLTLIEYKREIEE